MGLADNIRAKVHQGVLPLGVPEKIVALFGDGQACSACDRPIYEAQTRYEFGFPSSAPSGSTLAALVSGRLSSSGAGGCGARPATNDVYP
jgi:hypothetical protein